MNIKRPSNGTFIDVADVISAFIQPATAEIVAVYDDGAPGGQLFTIFCDFMGVEIGDNIEISSQKYIVRGIQKFESAVGRHSEIIVRKTL